MNNNDDNIEMLGLTGVQPNLNNMDPGNQNYISQPIDLNAVNTQNEVVEINSNLNNVGANFVNQNVNNSFLEPNKDQINIPQPNQENIGIIPPSVKKEKKSNKILFFILILLLICGIAFGLYFYLSEKPFGVKSVNLKDLEFEKNEVLPVKISSYASLVGIDESTCVLDLSSVKTNIAGEYKYSLECDSEKYNATITIIDNDELEVVSKNHFAFKGDTLKPEYFIDSCTKDNCEYKFKDENKVLGFESTIGGPYDIEIIVNDESGESVEVNSKLYVILGIVKCTSSKLESKNFNATYTNTDVFYIGEGSLRLDHAVRNYTYKFSDKKEYQEAVKTIEKSAFDGVTGKITTDDKTLEIDVEVVLTDETLDLELGKEFYRGYSDIKKHYQNKSYDIEVIIE